MDDQSESRLPLVDEHSIALEVSREVAWGTLLRFVESNLLTARAGPHTRLLGTDPPSGFKISAVDPVSSIELTGRHRFAEYRLVFILSGLQDGTTKLSARTYAAFPRRRGRIYRALVIGSRGHVAVTRLMLRSIQNRTRT